MEDRCVMCRATPCATTYVLVEHSPRRIRGGLGRDDLERRVLETYPMPLCPGCVATVERSLARRKLVAACALGGLAVACGYFVAAIVGAPTPIALGLLFGGFGAFVAFAVAMVIVTKRLVAWLPIADNRGNNIRFFTTSYAALDAELATLRLQNAEILNQLERPGDAAALPVATLRE